MILVLSLAIVEVTVSSEILFILPTASRSHQFALQPIYRELSLRGHNVTTLTVYPMNEPSLINLTEIDWSRSHYLMTEVFQLTRRVQEEGFSAKLLKYAESVFRNLTGEQFLHPNVQYLLNDSKRKFDLVILENFAFAFYFFAEKYDCPIVLAASLPLQTYNLNSMGAPDHPVLYPDRNLGFVSSLSLLERIWSVLYSFWFDYQIRWNYISSINRKAKERFGLYDSTIQEVERKRVSLLIETSIPVFHTPRALVPNIISINGLHIQTGKPLAEVIIATPYVIRSMNEAYQSV